MLGTHFVVKISLVDLVKFRYKITLGKNRKLLGFSLIIPKWWKVLSRHFLEHFWADNTNLQCKSSTFKKKEKKWSWKIVSSKDKIRKSMEFCLQPLALKLAAQKTFLYSNYIISLNFQHNVILSVLTTE